MANRYGQAALMASQQGTSLDPKTRWESAVLKLYPTSPTARKKSRPRSAFLGLCEEGLVKGIPPGNYSASREDKAYAVHAAALLSNDPQSWSITTLWRAVTDDPEKLHSSQMDVVMALWKNDLIVRKT